MFSLRLTRLSREVASVLAGSALFMTAALHMPTAVAQTDPLADVQKLVKQGQLPQALERTDSYLVGKPKDPQARFLRGLILTEMNRSADAIAVFTKLSEDYPELPEPYNNLAVLHAQARQYDKARNALEMAIRTHPAYAIAHENLGDVYSKLASQAYDKALQLDTSNTGAQTKLSLIRELISVSARQSAKPATGGRGGQSDPLRMTAADMGLPARKPPVPSAAAKPPLPATPVAVIAAAPPAPAAPVTPPAPAAAVAPVAPAKPLPVAAPTTPPVSPPVVAAAPVKAPAPPVAKPAPSTEEVAKALQDWAAAWSRKDVKSYLARYAGDFTPPSGQSRKEWANEREARITKPGKIDVDVQNVQVTYDGPDKATVRFRQHYRSANLKSQASKTIVFVRSGGKWLILQERVS